MYVHASIFNNLHQRKFLRSVTSFWNEAKKFCDLYADALVKTEFVIIALLQQQ